MKLCSLLAAASLGIAGAAGATAIHGSFVGTDYTFGTPGVTGQLVQETSNAGDPEPLFGAPVVVGNVLLFSPAAFTAQASGAGGFADTGSQLQFELVGNTALDFIDKITLQEFGDAVFVGLGTAATGAFINMAGFVTVLEVDGSAITPLVIGFTGTFTAGPSFDLVSNPGTTLWKGEAVVDIDAALAANSIPFTGGATKVRVSLDNDLYAFSEAGTLAKVQKKVANGVVITVPEPAALAWLALGALGFALRRRI